MRLSSFAVVIPMYNEEAGAESCVRAVCAELNKIENRSSLIVVEDGSSDKTAAVLDELLLSHDNMILVKHGENRGYGAGLKTGVDTAAENGFEYTLFMDSDLTNDPADIPRFAAEMNLGFDVIKATRYSHGGKLSGVPAYREIISRTGNFIARMLCGLPLHDLTNGFRAVKVDLLRKFTPQENKFSIIMEELYYLKYLAKTYKEIPVILTNRPEKIRPTSFSYRPSTFWRYLKYPLRCAFGSNPFKEG